MKEKKVQKRYDEEFKRQREILKKAVFNSGRVTEQRYAMIEELSVQFRIQEVLCRPERLAQRSLSVGGHRAVFTREG